MTKPHEIESKVRTFIVDSFLTKARAETFQLDDDLLKLLDSLQILRMVIALERDFGIKVEDADMSPENLGSVRKLACLVDNKLHNGHRRTLDGSRANPNGITDPGTSAKA